MLSAMSFSSCDYRDDVRNDIEEIEQKLNELEARVSEVNLNISNLNSVLEGKLLISSCISDDDGNYTLQLSDNSSWKVYSSDYDEELPHLEINTDNQWVYSYNGEEVTLEGACLPIDGQNGIAPELQIKDGYWYYKIGESEPVLIPGSNNVASISLGIFEHVKLEGNIMMFKLKGSEEYIQVPLMGGLDMVFSGISDNDVSLTKGTNVEVNFTTTNVSDIIICPTILNVSIVEDSNKVIIAASADMDAGDYIIDFEIYSPQGYRKVVSLDVTVNESGI